MREWSFSHGFPDSALKKTQERRVVHPLTRRWGNVCPGNVSSLLKVQRNYRDTPGFSFSCKTKGMNFFPPFPTLIPLFYSTVGAFQSCAWIFYGWAKLQRTQWRGGDDNFFTPWCHWWKWNGSDIHNRNYNGYGVIEGFMEITWLNFIKI